MEKKKINITVNKANWEEMQGLVRELGWKNNWLSSQIDKMVAGLIVVAKQAKKDAADKKEMTDAEARKRYEHLMRKILEG